MDISMVDPAFTSEKPTDQTENESLDGKSISTDNQKKFEGFTFVPETEIDKERLKSM
jgi:hypothetical protein